MYNVLVCFIVCSTVHNNWNLLIYEIHWVHDKNLICHFFTLIHELTNSICEFVISNFNVNEFTNCIWEFLISDIFMTKFTNSQKFDSWIHDFKNFMWVNLRIVLVNSWIVCVCVFFFRTVTTSNWWIRKWRVYHSKSDYNFFFNPSNNYCNYLYYLKMTTFCLFSGR